MIYLGPHNYTVSIYENLLLNIYIALASVMEQEGYLKKSQMIYAQYILEIDKNSTHFSIYQLFILLCLCHICMDDIENKIFLKLWVFNGYHKATQENSLEC